MINFTLRTIHVPRAAAHLIRTPQYDPHWPPFEVPYSEGLASGISFAPQAYSTQVGESMHVEEPNREEMPNLGGSAKEDSETGH